MSNESITENQIDKLISLEAVAENLSLSLWTVRAWVSKGRIKSKKLGSRRLVPVSELRRLINEGLD